MWDSVLTQSIYENRSDEALLLHNKRLPKRATYRPEQVASGLLNITYSAVFIGLYKYNM